MPVLFIISEILKSGAEIYRDNSDGSLALRNSNLVPGDVLKAAEPIFDKIESYYKSVEGMDKVDTRIHKMIFCFCGWIEIKVINDFLNCDETALNLFMDYQVELTKNGWVRIYDDYRQFENERSKQLKVEIFNRLVAFGKGVKQ